MQYTPHPYQATGIDFMLDRFLSKEPGAKGAGLFLDPGMGKTSMTLSVLEKLWMLGEIQTALVVAPLRVCRSVWPVEIEKWGCELSCVQMLGPARKRLKALDEEANIRLINPEGIPWLANKVDLRAYDTARFDTLVLDESTKFKTWGAARTKAIRKLLPHFKRRLILTGTPSPNHLGDLHAQIYMLDDGAALGKTQSYFRSNYMHRGGFKGKQWLPNPKKMKGIEEEISPMVLRLDAEDHLDMPRVVNHTIPVELPAETMREYKRLEKQLFMHLQDGEELIASSAGAMYGMCKGVANGGAYKDGEKLGERVAVHLHDEKVKALIDLVDELAGKSVLVAYQYKHDLERLKKKFPDAPVIAGGVKPEETDEIIQAWNEERVQVLLCQPQAMSHGLNLQKGGHDIAWFGLTDSLETYQQLNGRLYRQGQKSGYVRIHHILANDTVDQMIYQRLHDKAENQKSLLDSLNDYRKSKTAAAGAV